MSLSVNIAPSDLKNLATYVHTGVLELRTRSILHWSKWHQKYVVICKDNSSTLNLFVYENHLAEKADAVYLVKEFESVQTFGTNDKNNIIGFTIKFEKPQIKPLVFSCDTEKSLEEWVEHIRDSIVEAKQTSTDSAYASGGSACRDSCRTSKPYFTIDDSDVIAEDIPTNIPKEIPKDINNDNETSRKITETSSTTTVNQKVVSTNEKAHNVLHEDIPKGINSEEETWRKIAETSSTTTMNQTDASKENKATRTGKKHGRNDAVKDHVVDKDERNAKAMTSIPVQESKEKALPGPSGKFIVKERTHGLTTNPVQASDDEDSEDQDYENVTYVRNPDTRTDEMENLKPPINYDSNSDQTNVKAMTSIPVQESKGKALPGPSGKFIVKERTHGLTTNPVQASDDEDSEDQDYENVPNVRNPDTRKDEMDNLKPPINYDSNSDQTNVKAMTSIPVQESKAGKALPGPSGKFIVKERTHGLTTNPVQASDDEDSEDQDYENVTYVRNPDTRTDEMENLKPPINYDSNSDQTNVKAITSIPVQESKAGKALPGHSGKFIVKEETHGLTTNPVQAFNDEDSEDPDYENVSYDIPQSAMLSVRQPHTSQMGAEDLESQKCSSSFVSAREGRDKISFQTDSQQTTFVNTEPVYSRPHKKSSKSGETGAINNRNLPSSASSNSFSSVGSDASFKYESPEDTDQDELENIFKREDYFCPDRKQAIRQIEKSSIGTFLVCLNKDKCEVICFMTNLGPKVFKVHRREDGYSLFEPKMGMVFPTLDKLLAHYHINDLPSREYKVKLERVYQSK